MPTEPDAPPPPDLAAREPPAAGSPADAPPAERTLPAWMPPEADTPATRAYYAELTAHTAAVRALTASVDVRGMTRPPRHPDERAWLAARGGLGPFAEREA